MDSSKNFNQMLREAKMNKKITKHCSLILGQSNSEDTEPLIGGNQKRYSTLYTATELERNEKDTDFSPRFGDNQKHRNTMTTETATSTLKQIIIPENSWEEDTKDHWKTTLKVIAISIVAIIVCLLAWKYLSGELNYLFMTFIKEFARQDTFTSNAFFILVHFMFSWFMIPGMTYFDIIMTAFMKDFWRAYSIIFWGTYVGGIISFVAVKWFLKDCILRKYGNNIIYTIFREEVEKNPWGISALSNILMVPNCLKNLVLPLTDMTLVQFMVPKFPIYMLLTLLSCMIGDELADFESLLSGKKLEAKTPTQVFEFYLTVFFLLLTVVVMGYVGVRFKKKIKKYQEAQEMSERDEGFGVEI